MSFYFALPVDPVNHIDSSDQPPDGWDTIDTQDHRQALFVNPSDLFVKCSKWAER